MNSFVQYNIIRYLTLLDTYTVVTSVIVGVFKFDLMVLS